MSAALIATGLISGSGPSTWRLAPIRSIAAAAIPYAALLRAWFTFFYVIWGSPLPSAPYGAMVQTSPWNLLFGAPACSSIRNTVCCRTRRSTHSRRPGSGRCGVAAASSARWRSG